MDEKRSVAEILALAEIWDDLEPAFVEHALSGLAGASVDAAAAAHPEEGSDMGARIFISDPLEAAVRSRVLALIGAAGEAGAISTPGGAGAAGGASADASAAAAIGSGMAGENPEAGGTGAAPEIGGTDTIHSQPAFLNLRRRIEDFRRNWQKQPYTRMAAAALVIVLVAWLMSLPFISGGTASVTTAATTRAATTAAAATTRAATTAAATTAAAGTTTYAATTAAGTTPASTTAATTRPPTGATTAATTASGQLVWPLHLVKYLGFDFRQVDAVEIQRYRTDGSFERARQITSRDGLNQIVDLLNQMYLDRPTAAQPAHAGVFYELDFQLSPGVTLPATGEPVLTIMHTTDPDVVRISGTFTLAPEVNAPDGLMQANASLTAADLFDRLDALLG